jgi:hypothetical protein
MSFFSSPSLPCRIVTVTTNTHTKFKTCRTCRLILWPGLSVCHQGHLAYQVVVASPSVGAGDCFLLFSVAFLFLHDFQLSYLLVFPSSEYIFSFATRLFSELNKEASNTPSCLALPYCNCEGRLYRKMKDF